MNQSFEHFLDADTGLRRDADRFRCIEPDDVLDFLAHLFRFRCGQVNLVQYRDDLVIGFDRKIGVGQRLRFDSLG